MSEYTYIFDTVEYHGEVLRASRTGGISEQDARDFTRTRAPHSLTAESAIRPKSGQWINDARADGFTFTGARWVPVVDEPTTPTAPDPDQFYVSGPFAGDSLEDG